MDSSRPLELLTSRAAEVGANHSSTFNYSFLGCFLSWCCYGVIMAQAWTYFRVFHKDPRWLKWSAFVVFLLNTAKASLELSRVVLSNGIHLGDVSYALSWRRHLQDPFISFSSVALVSLCEAMLVVRCIACLKSGAEGKESRGRVALKTSLIALLVLSTSFGVAEMALVYSYRDYLQLILAHLSLRLVPSTILNICWAAASALLQTILTAILTSDLLCVYDDIQPNANERAVRRIAFVFVRNGFPILLYQVVFMFFYALSYTVWLTVPLSLTPQLYSITTLVYISAPRRSTRLALHPPPPPFHSCNNPDDAPNPNSSETNSWGSCTCTCCSHHTSRAEVGLHALAKVKERWRSSVRRIRIGETGVTRGVELVEKEEGERHRIRSRLGEGGVNVVEMKSRGSVGGGGKSKDSSKGSVSVATSSMGGGAGGISVGAVKSWGRVDQEESWIERSERMLTPQTSALPTPSPHPSPPLQQPASHPSDATPPPPSRRRPSSSSLDASNDVLGLPVLNDPTAPNSPLATVSQRIGASTQFGSMGMDEGEADEEDQGERRGEAGRGGNGGALGFEEGSRG